MDRGFVSFVGLGPSDRALLTVRAADRIAQADIVFYDAERVSAARLIELARAGRRVVRAMAGDVLESQQGLEDVREVARAHVAFEVVPGIGARGAAAAYAGAVGRAVRVEVGEVASAVANEPPEAPVTLIASAGEPCQRVLCTHARDASERAKELGKEQVIVAFSNPEEALRWFEHRPLFGKRVLVTRAREQAEATAALLREQGAEPLVAPAIVIRPPSDPEPLARALSDLRAGRYSWVAFTSANGVERTWQALIASGGDGRAFGAARLAAIGPATARALEGHGLRADVVAKEFRGEGLAEAMLEGLAAQNRSGLAKGNDRVLLARAARARDALPQALRAAGYAVDVVSAYETQPPPRDAVGALVRELEAGRVDAVTFTSSSTVEHLCDLLGKRAGELLQGVRVASIGPLTTETALARGLRVDVTASKFTVPEMVRALAESWAR